MIIIAKLVGFFLLIAVGHHYINQALGFSVAGSIAIIIFAICLLSLYQGYVPERKNWAGWCLIIFGCLVLSSFSSFNLFLLVPGFLIIMGYKLAELPVGNLSSIDGDGGSSGDGFGSDSGCGGD